MATTDFSDLRGKLFAHEARVRVEELTQAFRSKLIEMAAQVSGRRRDSVVADTDVLDAAAKMLGAEAVDDLIEGLG